MDSTGAARLHNSHEMYIGEAGLAEIVILGMAAAICAVGAPGGAQANHDLTIHHLEFLLFPTPTLSGSGAENAVNLRGFWHFTASNEFRRCTDTMLRH
jgi:hypothetical protein